MQELLNQHSSRSRFPSVDTHQTHIRPSINTSMPLQRIGEQTIGRSSTEPPLANRRPRDSNNSGRVSKRGRKSCKDDVQRGESSSSAQQKKIDLPKESDGSVAVDLPQTRKFAHFFALLLKTVYGTDASECKYEIIVKRLHYGTYSLHVWQSLPILELKLLISCLSGVIPELQRLLFHGRALEDDKVVSDYRILLCLSSLLLFMCSCFLFSEKWISLNELIQDVQQGHTLYLVTRTRLSQTESSNAVADPILRRQRFRVDVGDTFNFSLASDDNSNLGLAKSLRCEHFSFIGQDTPNESLSRYSYHTTGRLYDTPVVMPDSYTFISGYLNFLRQYLNGACGSCKSYRFIIPKIARIFQSFALFKTRRSQMQTSTREGNIPVATNAPRNVEITRHVRVGFLWPSPSSQQHVSSLQVATEEEELEDPDLEDEMSE
ncbi:unnamed protein product [Arabis nemorensis]|uniref:Ubiquitin-like domain-containing protein n=1 Tax=Arabis nemorensis TaxID=586526 RepID=A0A565CJX4_9BRAS|nr:unnamed protein product [Arabis nemorensis]